MLTYQAIQDKINDYDQHKGFGKRVLPWAFEYPHIITVKKAFEQLIARAYRVEQKSPSEGVIHAKQLLLDRSERDTKRFAWQLSREITSYRQCWILLDFYHLVENLMNQAEPLPGRGSKVMLSAILETIKAGPHFEPVMRAWKHFDSFTTIFSEEIEGVNIEKLIELFSSPVLVENESAMYRLQQAIINDPELAKNDLFAQQLISNVDYLFSQEFLDNFDRIVSGIHLTNAVELMRDFYFAAHPNELILLLLICRDKNIPLLSEVLSRMPKAFKKHLAAGGAHKSVAVLGWVAANGETINKMDQGQRDGFSKWIAHGFINFVKFENFSVYLDIYKQLQELNLDPLLTNKIQGVFFKLLSSDSAHGYLILSLTIHAINELFRSPFLRPIVLSSEKEMEPRLAFVIDILVKIHNADDVFAFRRLNPRLYSVFPDIFDGLRKCTQRQLEDGERLKLVCSRYAEVLNEFAGNIQDAKAVITQIDDINLLIGDMYFILSNMKRCQLLSLDNIIKAKRFIGQDAYLALFKDVLGLIQAVDATAEKQYFFDSMVDFAPILREVNFDRIPEHLFTRELMIQVFNCCHPQRIQEIPGYDVYRAIDNLIDRTLNPHRQIQAPYAAVANRNINNAQSTHVASVHRSVSESALRLKQYYDKHRININDELEQMQLWVTEVVEGGDWSEANKKIYWDAILSAVGAIIYPRNGNFVDKASGVSTRQLLAMAWNITHNEIIRRYEKKDGSFDAAPDDAARRRLYDHLYEVYRGYNLDENGRDRGGESRPICTAGTFNKIMAALETLTPLVVINYVTKEVAAEKLPALVKAQVGHYIASRPRNTEAEKQALNALLDQVQDDIEVIWEEIKAGVKKDFVSEFGEVFMSAGALNQQEVDAFVQAGLYVDVSNLIEDLRKKCISTGSNLTLFRRPDHTKSSESDQLLSPNLQN